MNTTMKTLRLFLLAALILLSACQASGVSSTRSRPDISLKTEAPLETAPVPEPMNIPISSTTTPVTAGNTVTQTRDMEGVWSITTHPHYKQAYWLVREDGTYKFSPNPDGGKPSESGKYWFENGQFFTTDDFCPKPGRYEVQKSGGSAVKLSMTLVEDQCTARVKILTGDFATWYQSLQ